MMWMTLAFCIWGVPGSILGQGTIKTDVKFVRNFSQLFDP
jgi:hypothetical protein